MSNNRNKQQGQRLKELCKAMKTKGVKAVPSKMRGGMSPGRLGPYDETKGIRCGSVDKAERVISERGLPLAYMAQHGTTTSGPRIVLLYPCHA